MTFSFRPAKRENVSLLIGLAGGTGSGKTFTAMKLASGIAGDKPFAVIDTEAGRAKHYADQFKFDHGDLMPPFRPQAYIDAIMAADKAGYPVIVVDSISHVWAGDGGILDWQEEELNRMAGDDWKKREAVKMAAWIKPKMAHKHMVQKLLQVRAHLILCFRAEEKIEMVKGEDGKMKIIQKQTLTGLSGWVPICEKNLPFELTVSFLLTADAPGMPKPIKLQEQHRALFPLDRPINEESGKLIAQWAMGGEAKKETKQVEQKQPETKQVPWISEAEIMQIENALDLAGISVDEFLEAGKVASIAEVKNVKGALAWIKKNAKNGQNDNAYKADPSVDDLFAMADDAVQCKDFALALDLASQLPENMKKLIVERCP